jgi:metal-responsive CopG/Arc/MetJ family transcriptional regulator
MALLKTSTMPWAHRMATVNFSVPDDIKAEFDRVFGSQNKSAVIADLMRKAIAEVKQRKRREDIFRLLTQLRRQRPSLSDEQIRRSRTAGRP